MATRQAIFAISSAVWGVAMFLRLARGREGEDMPTQAWDMAPDMALNDTH
jgi:hypothetical protein